MYKCKDALGRTWEVTEEALYESVLECLVDDVGMTREDAIKLAEEDKHMWSNWFVEQLLPNPWWIMKIGTMVEDVSDERKREILESYAVRSMNELG